MNNSGLVFSVSDFIAVVNQTFDYAYPTVEIVGEVASFKVNQGKFIFFDLKDEQGVVNCFMTVWQLRIPVEDGMKVVVSATPKLTDKGKFSLTVKSIRLSGEGSIKKGFDILKAKLSEEGLFDESRKRPLPYSPKNIAVISSVQAAGYADFMDILAKRWGGMSITVANVQVQGEAAADQIVNAINYVNKNLPESQVIAIVRGGGSAEDLAVFNDEFLVRAIASSSVPIIVGVGHEIDVSLADLAADVSAITPSNAAQILVPDKNETIKSLNYQILSCIRRIDQGIETKMAIIRNDLSQTINLMRNQINHEIDENNSRKRLIAEFNPDSVLRKGYAIIRGEVAVGNLIKIETQDKIIETEVKNVERK